MKNKLTKIYNIFKQIENMNGTTGWDQTEVFYYFYEENNFINCWKLLYGLFCENKNLKPGVFGITLLELRKYALAISTIYEFGNSEEPILIATFNRNSKHQISGIVNVKETMVSEKQDLLFVDGMNIDKPIENIKDIFDKDTIVPEIIPLTDSESRDRISNGLVVLYHNNFDELIELFTNEQFEEVIDMIGEESDRFFIFDNTDENFVIEDMFRIDGEIPESLYTIEDCKLFMEYINNDCGLLGSFHLDGSFNNYEDEFGNPLFNKTQQEKYAKYLDDMFELDADGNSLFVENAYDDIYDFCINYNNTNFGINEIYPCKIEYGKQYIRRDGIISGILKQVFDSKNIFLDKDNNFKYLANGRFIDGKYNTKNPQDLIEEI